MTKTIKISVSIICGLIVIMLAAYLYWRQLSRPIELPSSVEITIETGEGLTSIAEKLLRADLIRSDAAFKFYASDKAKKFKAGHYVFNGQLSFERLANSLIEGDKIGNVQKITIPEGWTAKEIDNYLAKNNKFSSGEFLNAMSDPKLIEQLKKTYTFLDDKPSKVSLEGYLFPDTYNIYKNATANEVTEKMLANFDRKLKPEWREAIRNQGKSVFEIVTMASIIEKEVRKQEDMKMVSDIFWRRIKSRQGLESCATLAYILGINKAQYSLEDTQVDSPYNTYRNKGLPPGPISNPGANAIEAAIFPQANNFGFFLTANGTGETIYSTTFEEHVRNKNKYLK